MLVSWAKWIVSLRAPSPPLVWERELPSGLSHQGVDGIQSRGHPRGRTGPQMRLHPAKGVAQGKVGGFSELGGWPGGRKGAQPCRGSAHASARPGFLHPRICSVHKMWVHKQSATSRPPSPLPASAGAVRLPAGSLSCVAPSRWPPKTPRCVAAAPQPRVCGTGQESPVPTSSHRVTTYASSGDGLRHRGPAHQASPSCHHRTPDPQWVEHLYCHSVPDCPLPLTATPGPPGQFCLTRGHRDLEGKKRLPGPVGPGHNLPGAPRTLGTDGSCPEGTQALGWHHDLWVSARQERRSRAGPGHRGPRAREALRAAV